MGGLTVVVRIVEYHSCTSAWNLTVGIHRTKSSGAIRKLMKGQRASTHSEAPRTV